MIKQTTKKQCSPDAVGAPLAEKITVEFVLDSPMAHSVAVAGNFNNWETHQTPLRKGVCGDWRATVPLPPGLCEYRFLVDGQWLNDPKAIESSPNPFGSENSVRVVEHPTLTRFAPTKAASQNHVPLQRQPQGELEPRTNQKRKTEKRTL